MLAVENVIKMLENRSANTVVFGSELQVFVFTVMIRETSPYRSYPDLHLTYIKNWGKSGVGR